MAESIAPAESIASTESIASDFDRQAQEREAERKKDVANLKKIGRLHFVMFMGALTLWGAADAWAVSTDWGLAWAVAFANALIATTVVTGIAHEWGHYAGARLTGARAPVKEEPVNYFFLFDFPFEDNDKRQFLWMSLGGILVPWLLVLLTAALVPIDNPSRALLLAAFVARAVSVSLFEGPVVMRTRAGGDPGPELVRQLKGSLGLRNSGYLGTAVGAVVWLVA